MEIAELVRRAQTGDRDAWALLVAEFHDVAMGLAMRSSEDPATAADIAQDAFVTAFEHIDDLRDPQAFPAWFVTIVRSAAHRHVRRERRHSESRRAPTNTTSAEPDPLDAVASDDESQRVRAAIERLPEHERSVVTLHYLAGLPYPRVAELLGISLSAAKKRAYAARRRLKESLPAAASDLVATGPASRSLPASVAIFLAIRLRDQALVRELLTREPGLVGASEHWSKDDAMALGLQNAEHATPLVRAVQSGDVALVSLLLEAGADPVQPCGCAGGESALWTATLHGDARMVEVLLAAGANADAAAFSGSTPLAVAAQRGNHEITRLLLAAGADPSLADAGGRTAADWSVVRRAGARRTTSADLIPTGVRAVDLFAPVRRGSVQWWPAAWELGQFALLTELVRSMGPGEFWQVGFETGPYDAESGRQWVEQFPIETRLCLTPASRSASERRAHFDSALRELGRSSADKIVMVLTAPGHHHDTTLAVAQLADNARVLTTIVIEPATRDVAEPRVARPEGFDSQVAFDPWRARRQLWPAVDPLTTTAATYPSARHEHLADAARSVVGTYRAVDPELELRDPAGFAEPEAAARAQRLHRCLAQPFHLWEHATGLPGESTPYDELLDTITTLLGP